MALYVVLGTVTSDICYLILLSVDTYHLRANGMTRFESHGNEVLE